MRALAHPLRRRASPCALHNTRDCSRALPLHGRLHGVGCSRLAVTTARATGRLAECRSISHLKNALRDADEDGAEPEGAEPDGAEPAGVQAQGAPPSHGGTSHSATHKPLHEAPSKAPAKAATKAAPAASAQPGELSTDDDSAADPEDKAQYEEGGRHGRCLVGARVKLYWGGDEVSGPFLSAACDHCSLPAGLDVPGSRRCEAPLRGCCRLIARSRDCSQRLLSSDCSLTRLLAHAHVPVGCVARRNGTRASSRTITRAGSTRS